MDAIAPENAAADAGQDQYYEELKRLFNLYRLSHLNAQYYGIRAEKYEKRNKGSLIVTAALSMLALSVILVADPKNTCARDFAAACAGLAAFLSGVVPFFGWSEKIRDLRNQHFAYSQLFGQIEFAMTEIRRAGQLTPEHVGLARMVHDGYIRIETRDELDPDRVLLNQEDAKVRKQIPEDYLWTNM